MFEREEEHNDRDSNIPYTSFRVDDDGEYEGIDVPSGAGLFPDSLFFLAKFVLGAILVIALPFLIISFTETIATYVIVLIAFTAVTFISRKSGYRL